MKLTQDEIRNVAKLADLPLSPEEGNRLGEQLSKILEYIGQLNEVDTSKTEPTFNVSPNTNVTREDETIASLNQDEVLANASNQKKGFFVTKGVFDNE